jgi:hypothetical protein
MSSTLSAVPAGLKWGLIEQKRGKKRKCRERACTALNAYLRGDTTNIPSAVMKDLATPTNFGSSNCVHHKSQRMLGRKYHN